ncbi:Gfo/Idh/MocA family protein [Companilactobacillus jidongensis]|uniref:Gfo/Idh/MocA family protein n=1 Tax=Companilactobacillus jidongensis TaxID=2486006 RepID=UPI000F76C23F|nr:Gfo/Idh/MocA family oxidoreductase [Companilactobacillus jidongensis]
MEKIGVIGLGNIAQKAYLPVMASLQDQYEWHLATRNIEKGQKLATKYGFSHLHQTLDQLIAEKPLAVFVHTPTSTHASIIKQLLNAGINVYVDKPVSEDLQVVEELYKLAAANNLMLTCGFNRRFAPFNQELKQIADKRLITSEKIRENSPQPVKFAIFDLMIHSVDTALYLMDEPIQNVTNHLVTSEGNLEQGYITLSSEHEQVQITTSLVGGINLEKSTVQGSTERDEVTNLSLLNKYQTGVNIQESRPDWERNLITRGFEPLIIEFLNAITHDGTNPVSPDSAILSHKVCTDLLQTL